MLSKDAENAVQYRMTGTGRAGYVIFGIVMALFTAALIAIAASSKSVDFILWLLIAGAGVFTVDLARSALSQSWRITTYSWGFEVPNRPALSDAWRIAAHAYGLMVPDRDTRRIPWSEVASYHYSDIDDSTQWVVVHLKPGATRPQSVGLDVTNLEPSVRELLRTFDRAIVTST